MSFDFSSFNPAENLDSSFDVLPAGDYLVVVIEASVKKTKEGTGEYLAITMEVIDGEYLGRRIWHNIMLVHPNEAAVQIGKRHLAELCISAGLNRLTSELDLINRTALVAIKVAKRDDGTLRNEVRSYKKIGHTPISSSDEIPF
ncbi:MAG: hypothetical protein KatS3mg105_5048 [Gemmatales bacterium]|nr:MAG: hypothetical protein KatS3mg105_5048 [Gemmatales bacterium]